MIEKLIASLERDKDVIPKEQFHEWKRNPVTQQLFEDLTIQLLSLQQEQPPADTGGAAVFAHRAYAAQEFLKGLIDWEPLMAGDDDEA